MSIEDDEEHVSSDAHDFVIQCLALLNHHQIASILTELVDDTDEKMWMNLYKFYKDAELDPDRSITRTISALFIEKTVRLAEREGRDPDGAIINVNPDTLLGMLLKDLQEYDNRNQESTAH